MKKILSLLFVCVLWLSLSNEVSYASAEHLENYYPQYEKQATVLNELGLLNIVDVTEDDTPIYDLQQQASRLQGLIMTIDFLGKTEEGVHFFTKSLMHMYIPHKHDD